MKAMNEGALDSRLRSQVPVELLHESPYLDHKLDKYYESHPNPAPVDVLKYLQSVESDAARIIRTIDVPDGDVPTAEVRELTGRDGELRLLDIYLNRLYKNNVILVGAPGVGKTALVLYYFRSRSLPLISISAAEMLSGTKYRGEFEQRMQLMIKKAQQEKSTIFFDEIHTLIHAGASEGGISAVNLLKPVITETNIRIIGATTPQEAKELYKDGAFERRFSFLKLEEPNKKMLRQIGEQIIRESGNSQGMSAETYTEVFDFLDSHFPNRYYPDKLIDFLDFFTTAQKRAGLSFSEAKKLFADSQIRGEV